MMESDWEISDSVATSDEEPDFETKAAEFETKAAESETKAAIAKPFSLAQRSHLKYMHSIGMTSCSKKQTVLIQKAAKDTGLSVKQVKVIYRVQGWRRSHKRFSK